MMYQDRYPSGNSRDDKRLAWAERIAWLMDNQFRLPGTRFRFGLDPIINFVPFLGDISGFVISAALLVTMARHGASGKVLTLMILNILLDAVIGAIPVIGWFFDFGFKANARNIQLLKRHYSEGRYQGSGKGIIAAVLVIILLLAVLLIYLIWTLLEWFIEFF